MVTFSSSVKSENTSGVWKTRATPAWLIWCGARPTSDLPSKSTLPVSGVRRPTKQLSSVDFPAPLGPMMACTEPSSTFRFTSESARRPAKLLLTIWTWRSDMPLVPRSGAGIRRREPANAGARGGPPTPDPAAHAPCAFHHPTRQEDHEHHEEGTEGEVPALAHEESRHRDHAVLEPVGQEAEHAVQRLLVEGGENVFQVLDDDRAEDGAQQRAHAAQDGHEHDLARGGPLHALGAGERIGAGEERPGESGVHARDHEGRERVRPRMHAGVVQAVLVRLDRAQHRAERRARDAHRHVESGDQDYGAEVEPRIALHLEAEEVGRGDEVARSRDPGVD